MGAEPTAARRAALAVLQALRSGELLDRAWAREAERLEPRDRAWTQELVYGTVRLRARLDHYLDDLARGGTVRLDPDVLDVLRLGAYQLLEMGSVPAYAAVSQSVELARAAGAARAAGLVNAVLQGLRRRRDRIRFPDPAREPLQHLATWHSHPQWLVERWVERWGVDGARSLAEANNQRPELFLRPIGLGPAEARDRLVAAGIEAEPVPLAPDSLRVLPPAGAQGALAAVPAVVQDPAAALVVRYAAAPAGATVLDLCAAPGGKAVGLAVGAGYLAAADLSTTRQRRVHENVARLGLEERVGLVVADGRRPPFRPADVVLLDAPCTGTGTLRRHPDGRWRLTPADLDALAALQRELLHGAAGLVRPGGLLVYSTCSLEPEENERQIEALLERSPELRREPPAEGHLAPELLDERGDLRVLPQRHGWDGAYAARLRKAG